MVVPSVVTSSLYAPMSSFADLGLMIVGIGLLARLSAENVSDIPDLLVRGARQIGS